MTLPEFIVEHENDDLAALVLQRHRWPDIDVALAAECIASRRKLPDLKYFKSMIIALVDLIFHNFPVLPVLQASLIF
jgi:hypothetical protein